MYVPLMLTDGADDSKAHGKGQGQGQGQGARGKGQGRISKGVYIEYTQLYT